MPESRPDFVGDEERVSGSRTVDVDAAVLPRGYSGAGATADQGRTILDVEVVPELCMNFLNCMRIATGAFATDRQTHHSRATDRWPDVEPIRLWRAAWSCPTGAIRFATDQGYVSPRWEEAAAWRVDAHPAAGRRRDG